MQKECKNSKIFRLRRAKATEKSFKHDFDLDRMFFPKVVEKQNKNTGQHNHTILFPKFTCNKVVRVGIWWGGVGGGGVFWDFSYLRVQEVNFRT